MNAPRMPSLASALPVALAVLFLVRLLGCLDADPLGPGAGGASLAVHITAVRDGSLGKTDVPDTLRVVLHDVTGFPHTDAPESFPVAAEATAYTEREDATGRHLLSRLEVELLEERVFRVVVRFSFGENSTREAIAGQRTIALRPGDRKSIQMVMADAKRPASGEYGLSIARSTASPGARHGIPIVLRNGSPIGGLQFQVRFDKSALDTVFGIEVDPSSRLYAGATGDTLIGTRYAQPTDSTLRVLTVDLGPLDGDSLGGSIRPIPAGNDLLFFLLVGVSRGHPVLPDTVRLTLDEVFFSTPSGSADITVTDTTNGLVVVTD